MMPYLPSLIFEVAGVPIHWFSVLVLIGVLLGDRIIVKRGVRMGLDAQDIRYVNVRIVIGGFVMAHLVSVVFYYPHRITESPWVLLSVWSGLSSFGGFLGAALTFFWLMRREKLPARRFADAIALGLAPAWILGRIGCYTAHDHPGRRTDFLLGVPYPQLPLPGGELGPAGVRHDLGFYEAVLTAVITVVLYRVARRPRPPGYLIGLLAVLYAPPRFLLDFLRATDVERADARYAGLTPAQWAAVGCLWVGLWLMRTAKDQPELPERGTEPETDAGTGADAEKSTSTGQGSGPGTS